MSKAEQIREWLALVNAAQLATERAKGHVAAEDTDAVYELRRAGELLTEAFDEGLEAHGKAVLADHLAGETATVA